MFRIVSTIKYKLLLGVKAKLMDVDSPDWIPSQNLNEPPDLQETPQFEASDALDPDGFHSDVQRDALPDEENKHPIDADKIN